MPAELAQEVSTDPAAVPSVTDRVESLRQLMKHGAAIIVVKYEGVTRIFAGGKPIEVELAGGLANVKDDTGAGDMFAAAFIATRMSPLVGGCLGAQLGMHLARAKVADLGMPDGELLVRAAEQINFAPPAP